MPTLKIFTDGGSRGNPGMAGGGVVVMLNDEAIHEDAIHFGTKTNNEAEYLAVLHALEWLKNNVSNGKLFNKTEISKVEFYGDSKLVIQQLSQNWKLKEPRMRELAQKCWNIIGLLPYPVGFIHVLRDKNARADELANQAMDEAEA